jgi:hypothetical protein
MGLSPGIRVLYVFYLYVEASRGSEESIPDLSACAGAFSIPGAADYPVSFSRCRFLFQKKAPDGVGAVGAALSIPFGALSPGGIPNTAAVCPISIKPAFFA